MLARDLQSIVLYDQEGKFAGVRRPNSKLPIDIDGTKIVIVDAIGSSGLDLKVKFLFFYMPDNIKVALKYALKLKLCCWPD